MGCGMDQFVVERALAVVTDLARAGPGPTAVRHPLGFHCLPVVRADEYGLCVHVWDSGSDVDDPPPHSHSWELASYVLDGAVVNREIDVIDTAVGASDRVYAVDSVGDLDRVRLTARLVRRAERARSRTARGGTYTLRAGRFHATTVPPGSGAITVVKGTSVPGCHDLVLGPLDGEPHDTVRAHCDPAETTAVARLVLDRVQPQR